MLDHLLSRRHADSRQLERGKKEETRERTDNKIIPECLDSLPEKAEEERQSREGGEEEQ